MEKHNIDTTFSSIHGTYEVRAVCNNCGFGGKYRNIEFIKIPKGQIIEETGCPNCGCKTLIKGNK